MNRNHSSQIRQRERHHEELKQQREDHYKNKGGRVKTAPAPKLFCGGEDDWRLCRDTFIEIEPLDRDDDKIDIHGRNIQNRLLSEKTIHKRFQGLPARYLYQDGDYPYGNIPEKQKQCKNGIVEVLYYLFCLAF